MVTKISLLFALRMPSRHVPAAEIVAPSDTTDYLRGFEAISNPRQREAKQKFLRPERQPDAPWSYRWSPQYPWPQSAPRTDRYREIDRHPDQPELAPGPQLSASPISASRSHRDSRTEGLSSECRGWQTEEPALTNR